MARKTSVTGPSDEQRTPTSTSIGNFTLMGLEPELLLRAATRAYRRFLKVGIPEEIARTPNGGTAPGPTVRERSFERVHSMRCATLVPSN